MQNTEEKNIFSSQMSIYHTSVSILPKLFTM